LVRALDQMTLSPSTWPNQSHKRDLTAREELCSLNGFDIRRDKRKVTKLIRSDDWLRNIQTPDFGF
jgi:hypothetical protein